MKRFFLFLIISLVISLLYFKFKNNSCKNHQAVHYRLENKSYCLLVADSPQKWSRGLMFYKKTVDFDGMIFIFADKQPRTFWNKNTYLDLDIYWLEDEKIIGKTYLPSVEKSKKIVTVSTDKEVNRVLEIIR